MTEARLRPMEIEPMPSWVAVGVAATGAVVGAVQNKSASDKAKDAGQSATKNSLTLQKSIYDSNKAALQPYMDRGNLAGGNIQALLGLGGDQAAAEKAWSQFRNSSGYQTRLNQGLEAITQNKAVSGLLNSGSTLKGLNRFAQDYASNELGNYMGVLSQQQGAGLSAANALAGVGTNYANASSALNQNNAANIGNSALANASSNNALISNLIGLAGNFASSYQQPNTTQPRTTNYGSTNANFGRGF